MVKNTVQLAMHGLLLSSSALFPLTCQTPSPASVEHGDQFKLTESLSPSHHVGHHLKLVCFNFAMPSVAPSRPPPSAVCLQAP